MSTTVMAACCAVCSERASDIRYRLEVPGLSVCGLCAERVANAFNKVHSGRWLTWAEPPAPKKAKAVIPRSLSKRVFERDGYRCVTCSGHVDLCCDHIVPESKGGATTFENLQAMCRPCNSRKGARQ